METLAMLIALEAAYMRYALGTDFLVVSRSEWFDRLGSAVRPPLGTCSSLASGSLVDGRW